MNPIRLLATMACVLALPHPAVADGDTVRVRMQTTAGSIDIELDAKRAPLTVANFLRHVDAGRYDGATFYRTVTRANDHGSPVIEVIQGGLGNAAAPWPPIAHESTAQTGLSHLDGTISMARGEAGTASSEFFICIGAQPGLDYGAPRNPDGQGFAAFGRAVSGMETVRRIHRQPAEGAADSAYVEGQMLTVPVRILEVRRVPPPGS